MDNIKKCFKSMLDRSRAKVHIGQVISLMIFDSTCWGAWVFTQDSQIKAVFAGATVLASGGAGGIFRNHLVSDEHAGYGYVLANEAGAKLKNMAFIQFMLGLQTEKNVGFLPLSSMSQSECMMNREGSDFLMTAIPDPDIRDRAVRERQTHFPFSCRDMSFLIDKNLAENQRKGHEIMWMAPHNHDQTEAARVVHLAHAFNGGIEIDAQAQTSIYALFSAGEVASGPHGADRVGGCMMTATQVFGKRAGTYSGRFAMNQRKKVRPQFYPPEWAMKKWPITKASRLQHHSELENRTREALSKNASIVRHAESLKKCLATLRECREELEITPPKKQSLSAYIERRFLLESAKLVVSDALRREYSLGAHLREDFPPTAPLS
jgi:L-aspartate oxidase